MGLAQFQLKVLSLQGALCCFSPSNRSLQYTLLFTLQALGGRLVFKTIRSGPALLTEAGQAVLPYCQQLVEVAGEACKAMQDFRVASTGVVSLGASQTVGTYLMPRLIAAFKKNNPEVGGWHHWPGLSVASVWGSRV